MVGGAVRGAGSEDGASGDVVGAGAEVEFGGSFDVGVADLDAEARGFLGIGGDLAGDFGVDLQGGGTRTGVGFVAGADHVVGAGDSVAGRLGTARARRSARTAAGGGAAASGVARGASDRTAARTAGFAAGSLSAGGLASAATGAALARGGVVAGDQGPQEQAREGKSGEQAHGEASWGRKLAPC